MSLDQTGQNIRFLSQLHPSEVERLKRVLAALYRKMDVQRHAMFAEEEVDIDDLINTMRQIESTTVLYQEALKAR